VEEDAEMMSTKITTAPPINQVMFRGDMS